VRDLPYVCHGWLAALVYSAVAAAFGLDAVPAVPTLVALLVFGAMVATARRSARRGCSPSRSPTSCSSS
jgi:CHASE2 domain-containing sensor protein